ncbi:hypothetical protein BurJ1DRAFT_2621 [Burkholderiales bacterium JOSHI_001]|nr:hypothetical protein BurJ1DRAFT_2621 [Burkholderiales bacterium JOSHI_001]
MSATLHPDPDWRGAARALVSGCLDLPDDDDRVALMEAVCRGLGDELYPAFLRVLFEVGRYGDHAARAAVARALVQALRTGRLPNGRRAAWGSASGSSSRGRSLGPLEYLCAWAAQAEGDAALPHNLFENAAQSVMSLVAASDEARQLYCEKLLAEAQDSLEGALTRSTRHAMAELARAWADRGDPAHASSRFVGALPQGSSSLAAMSSRWRQPVPAGA